MGARCGHSHPHDPHRDARGLGQDYIRTAAPRLSETRWCAACLAQRAGAHCHRRRCSLARCWPAPLSPRRSSVGPAGRLTVTAISNRDYALCRLSAVDRLTYVLVNLLTDVVYRWVNRACGLGSAQTSAPERDVNAAWIRSQIRAHSQALQGFARSSFRGATCPASVR